MISDLRYKFYLILVGNIVLVGLIALGARDLPYPLVFLRLILGLIYVLLIPGYLLQILLFPGNLDLDNVERVALSFALSGIIVPPVALLLDWLPWGIRQWPIVISLTAFILLCMVGAALRQGSLPAGEQLKTGSKPGIRQWWAGLERQYRVVYSVLASILVIASLTAISILVMPKPAEFFTEFYILGKDGLAEDYPREARKSQPVLLTIGVTNHERAPGVYRLEVWQVDSNDETHRQLVGTSDSFTLQVGENRQWDQAWQPAWEGRDQKFEFLLFTGLDGEPYRNLLLWMHISAK